MSIKIHEAHRLPVDQLTGFILKSRKHVFERTAEYIISVSKEWEKENEPGAFEKIAKNLSCRRITAVVNLAIDLFTRGTRIPQRNAFAIESGLNVWIHKGYAYVVPLYSSFIKLDLQNCSPGIEDFSYWNNADRPEEISEKDWNNRFEVWGQINCGHEYGTCHNDARLYHEYIWADGFGFNLEFEFFLYAKLEETTEDDINLLRLMSGGKRNESR